MGGAQGEPYAPHCWFSAAARPLNFWSMSFQTYLTNVNGSANDATAGNRAALMDTVNQAHFPDNTWVVLRKGEGRVREGNGACGRV